MPSPAPPRWSRTLLLLLVGINIVLQLTNATLIKLATELGFSRLLPVLAILSAVAILSFGRLVVWNSMHKRFPVSLAYPATALFFPCLVALAWFMGEIVTERQVFGVALVTFGVLLLIRAEGKQEHPSA